MELQFLEVNLAQINIIARGQLSDSNIPGSQYRIFASVANHQSIVVVEISRCFISGLWLFLHGDLYYFLYGFLYVEYTPYYTALFV